MSNYDDEYLRMIEKKRQELTLMYVEKAGTLDAELIELSEELNNLILPLQLENLEKTKPADFTDSSSNDAT